MQSLRTELAVALSLTYGVCTSCAADVMDVDQVAAAIQHAQYIDLDTTPTGPRGDLRYGPNNEFVARYHFTARPFRMGFEVSCPVPCTIEDLEWIENYAPNLALYNVEAEIENAGDWPLLVELTVEGACTHHSYVSSGGASVSIESQAESQYRAIDLEPGERQAEQFSCGDEATSFDDVALHVKQTAATPLPDE